MKAKARRSWARTRWGSRFLSQRIVGWATAITMTFLAVATWTALINHQLFPNMRAARGFGIGESFRYPSRVIADLKAVEGNVFNSPSLGGYLIWKMHPPRKIGLDGRWEVYGDSLPAFRHAFRDPHTFYALAKKHDIQAVLLDRNSKLAKMMFYWLWKDEAWTVTRSTRNIVLFVRNDP